MKGMYLTQHHVKVSITLSSTGVVYCSDFLQNKTKQNKICMIYTLTRNVDRICVKRCQAKTNYLIPFYNPTDAILQIRALQHTAISNDRHLITKNLQALSQQSV
jgi:hypothetical protein